MRKSILYVLFPLLIAASMLLAACGGATGTEIPSVKYEGENCSAQQFPLGKEVEITPGETVKISWVSTFTRENQSINGGAWMFAYKGANGPKVQAYGIGKSYSSQPTVGWKNLPRGPLSLDNGEYIFARLNTETLELTLLCHPIQLPPQALPDSKGKTNAQPIDDSCTVKGNTVEYAATRTFMTVRTGQQGKPMIQLSLSFANSQTLTFTFIGDSESRVGFDPMTQKEVSTTERIDKIDHKNVLIESFGKTYRLDIGTYDPFSGTYYFPDCGRSTPSDPNG